MKEFPVNQETGFSALTRGRSQKMIVILSIHFCKKMPYPKYDLLLPVKITGAFLGTAG